MKNDHTDTRIILSQRYIDKREDISDLYTLIEVSGEMLYFREKLHPVNLDEFEKFYTIHALP